MKTLVLAIAAIGLALLGLAGPATAASPSLPDPSKTGSINIHKFETPDTPTGLPNNGTAVSTAGLKPVPGVTFSIQKVSGIDLTTNQGWVDANALSGSFNAANASGSITAAGYTLAAAAGSPVTTDASGNAALAGLPLGLYLVTETSWPAGATPSAPFLVSVPLTDPTSQSAWLYDVNVYPKNAVTTIAKTVSDQAAVKLGDTVTWTIKADIPNVSPIDGYKVTDKLDTKLTYANATAVLADGTSLVKGTDYTTTLDAATNTLTVDFTAAGRTILAAHPASQVVVKVDTTVNAVGEIANTALLYPNQASFNVTPGQPGGPVVSPPVLTKWGAITLLKTNGSGAALPGAVFSVYATQADAEAGTNPISLGGQTTFTAGANGQVTISGLRYSDFANGVTVAPGDPGYRDYWLAEVKAPTGYELLADPIKFDVTAATTAVGVDLTIKNMPANAGFALPFTGGPGGVFIYLGGALLLLGALAIGLTRKRTAQS
ncbi:SpaH/EbpB family LPXTG-anchored major pilin [Nocardioides panacihumi]|uniref:SpaH/EbpB family LPXTG-anchored major pilin n=1 Tax=Nocardioides panacihumi TaxID=400774 RepID=UPI0031CE0399